MTCYDGGEKKIPLAHSITHSEYPLFPKTSDTFCLFIAPCARNYPAACLLFLFVISVDRMEFDGVGDPLRDAMKRKLALDRRILDIIIIIISCTQADGLLTPLPVFSTLVILACSAQHWWRSMSVFFINPRGEMYMKEEENKKKLRLTPDLWTIHIRRYNQKKNKRSLLTHPPIYENRIAAITTVCTYNKHNKTHIFTLGVHHTRRANDG